MRLIEKVKAMLGINSKVKAKTDYIGSDISRAVQRNELASNRAREALEDIKMSQTMREIVGKM